MTSIAPARTKVVVGVDTHKDEHVAVALDSRGVRLGELFAPATTDGYASLLQWSREFGEVGTFAVEGCSSYGAALHRFLRRLRISDPDQTPHPPRPATCGPFPSSALNIPLTASTPPVRKTSVNWQGSGSAQGERFWAAQEHSMLEATPTLSGPSSPQILSVYRSGSRVQHVGNLTVAWSGARARSGVSTGLTVARARPASESCSGDGVRAKSTCFDGALALSGSSLPGV